jgi:hypothetical protein
LFAFGEPLQALAFALLAAPPSVERSTSEMQSTGQGAMHSSQPVHSVLSTVCICRGAPMIASTGHGGRQRAQPMQRDSSITATIAGPSLPQLGSRASGSRPSSAASRPMVAAPPGGQRLIGASPTAMARAYGRQPW